MITAPQTAPRSPTGRIIYAVATAAVAGGLILVQPTEYGIKVAILSFLLLTCAVVPSIEKLAHRIQQRRTGEIPGPSPALPPLRRRFVAGVRNPVLVAVAVIAVAGPLNTALLARDKNIVLIERELTSERVQ